MQRWDQPAWVKGKTDSIRLSSPEALAEMSAEARGFGRWLNAHTGVIVEFFDERFSTTQAEEILKAANVTSKKLVTIRDQLAAQIMLTAYLESGGTGQTSLEGIE